jgi:DNA-binding transcriptional MerR regulator
METAGDPDLMLVPEVAAKLRRTVPTLRHWRKIGYGPPGFRMGRRVVYDRREVEAFIDSCRHSVETEGNDGRMAACA